MRSLLISAFTLFVLGSSACAPKAVQSTAQEPAPPPEEPVAMAQSAHGPELFSFAHGFLLHDDADAHLKDCVLRSWAGFNDCIIEIRTGSFDPGSECGPDRSGLGQSKILVAPACGWGLATYTSSEDTITATVRCRLEMVGVMSEGTPLPYNLVVPTPPIYKACSEEVRKSEFLMRWRAKAPPVTTQ